MVCLIAHHWHCDGRDNAGYGDWKQESGENEGEINPIIMYMVIDTIKEEMRDVWVNNVDYNRYNRKRKKCKAKKVGRYRRKERAVKEWMKWFQMEEYSLYMIEDEKMTRGEWWKVLVPAIMKSRTVPTWVFRQRKKRKREMKGGGEMKVVMKKVDEMIRNWVRQCVYNRRYDYMR